MSRHLSPPDLIRLRDGEAPDVGPLRDHLVECRLCREALEDARARSRDITASLPGGPELGAGEMDAAREHVRRRLARDDGHGLPPAARRERASEGFWSLSRAAGLLLLLAGGAAALPGSPVRSWISGPPSPAPPTSEAVSGPSSSPEGRSPDEAGIRVQVRPGPVVVSVTGLAPGARVEVERGPPGEVSVFAPEGSRFGSSDEGVHVAAERGPVRVTLPAGTGESRLRINDRTLLRWNDGGLELDVEPSLRTGDRVVLEVPEP